MRQRTALILLFAAIAALSFLFNRYELQNVNFGQLLKRCNLAAADAVRDNRSGLWQTKDGTTSRLREEKWTKKEQEVRDILARLDRMMPRLTFTDVKTTTSAKNSRATILNHKDSYCVGDHLLVRLDLYDYLGKRKEYGGDFLRARIHSLSLKAGASGHIEDYRNGTYLVNFTLFWEGTVRVSLLVIHPSEGVSALWAARKKGYDKIAFTGKFLNGTTAIVTQCGFNLSRRAELCEYRDERDQEAFYCVKPKNVPCDAFVHLQSNNAPISYLTALERSLFNRSNIGIEIPQKLGDIRVAPCNSSRTAASKTCAVGMRPPSSPSGFVWQNQWHPAFCSLSVFSALYQLHRCLKGKLVFFMGDSTVRQWMEHLTRRVSTLRYFDLHGIGKLQNLLAVDLARNIQVRWKKHGHPIVTVNSYTMKDHSYVPREIDHLAGDRDTAVVVALGQHFRPFPLELFIRRVLNVRGAIQRLLLRSPDTRIVIKAENVREPEVDQERFSDFHGYAHNLVVKNVFRDLNVGLIDAWDMTVAYATNNVHPPDHVVRDQVDMFLTYIC